MGGAGVQIVETQIFWKYCDESIFTWKNMQKKHEKKSDPCPQPGLPPDLAHGSELFGFFSFFGFLEVLAKLQKTMEKSKKVQAHVPSQASPQTLPMGLNFLFFCFFVFKKKSIVFLHAFHVNMLSSQYLSKNVRFYNLHTCAPQAKLQKKTWKTKLHLMTYIMTNIMIIYIYIYHDLFNK